MSAVIAEDLERAACISNKHRIYLGELDLPTRLLLGPGPSNMPPRVNLKLAAPLVGYMDHAYFNVMEDVKKSLRYLFQTDNEFTIPVSGAGRCALRLRCCFCCMWRCIAET